LSSFLKGALVVRFLILITAISSIVYCGEWSWCNPAPLGGQLSDVELFSVTGGMFIVGNMENLFIYNENSLPAFEVIPSPESPYWFRSASFIDDQNGYIGGEPFKIFRTSDSGENWIEVYATSQPDRALWEIEFLNLDHGYAVGGGKANSIGASGHIAMTHDGGENWYGVSTQYTIRAIEVFNQNNAMAVGDCGTVLRTTDGGLSWNPVETPAGTDINLYEIKAVTSNVMLITGERYELVPFIGDRVIYRSIDEGLSWQEASYPDGSCIRSICFSDTYTGIAVGSAGSILRSTDAGLSWSQVQSGVNAGIADVEFANGRWIAAGNQGVILESHDDGLTWNQLQESVSEVKLQDIYFHDQSRGFVSGHLGVILSTDDGGHSWRNQNTSIDNQIIFDVTFLDDNRGIAACVSFEYGNSVLYTADSGADWQVAYTSDNFLYAVEYLSETSVAFAVGMMGQILRSDNGGRDWRLIDNPPPTDIHLRRLCFVNQSIGFASGAQGSIGDYRSRILKTVDGGRNWTIMRPGSQGVVHVMDFCKPSIGIIGDEAEDVYLTTDGGSSWERILDLEEEYNLKDGIILDPGTIIVLYQKGNFSYLPPDGVSVFFCTFNAGETWISTPCPINWPLCFEYYPSLDRITVAGYSGEIRQRNDFLLDLGLSRYLEPFEITSSEWSRESLSDLDEGSNSEIDISVCNPVSGAINASITNLSGCPQRISCFLYSLEGRLIVENDLDVRCGSQQTLGLFRESSSIPAGSYILRLNFNGTEEVRKIVLLQ
jgi:photosystem II stability/assembly factor-like uncharacterized protein